MSARGRDCQDPGFCLPFRLDGLPPSGEREGRTTRARVDTAAMSVQTGPESPLADIRVLDLSGAIGAYCARLLAESLDHPEGKVKGFQPDVVGMFAYLLSHDAHHRGQISALARQLGHPLPKQATFGMWEWGSRWKECGFGGG